MVHLRIKPLLQASVIPNFDAMPTRPTLFSGLDSRTGLTDWTSGLDSCQCADEKSDCKIQVIMMTVINGLARQD